MDIIWHMGCHRTGSTTIQRFLEANRVRLAASKIEVWTPSRTRNGLFSGLVHAPADLTPDQIRRSDRASGLIRIELARLEAMGREALVVSEENMSGSIRANLTSDRLYPDFTARVQRMRQGFGRPVRRIGLAIRGYESYWSSALAFGVSHGFPVPGQDDLDRMVTQPRRWRDLVRGLATAVPEAEIVVWPFERFVANPKVALKLLSTQPVPRGLVQAEWANRGPRLPQLRDILSLRGEHAAARALPKGDGRWKPFDADQADALRAQYHEDIAWLRDGAEGLATYHDGLPATTGPKPNTQKPKTEIDVIGRAAASVAAVTRTIGGQGYGKQGHLA